MDVAIEEAQVTERYYTLLIQQKNDIEVDLLAGMKEGGVYVAHIDPGTVSSSDHVCKELVASSVRHEDLILE